MVFATHVPALGRYAFLLHGYQPAHPAFAVDVLISGGRVWQGEQPQRRGRAGPRAAALGVSSTPPPHPRVRPRATWLHNSRWLAASDGPAPSCPWFRRCLGFADPAPHVCRDPDAPSPAR